MRDSAGVKQPLGSQGQDEFFGRMNNPTAAASIRSSRGDEMEFHLVIRDDRVEDVRYYTEGCGSTRSSGRAVARGAPGKGQSGYRRTLDQHWRDHPVRRVRTGGRTPLRDFRGRHFVSGHRRLPTDIMGPSLVEVQQ